MLSKSLPWTPLPGDSPTIQTETAFIFPYFNNSKHLLRQLELWMSYDESLRHRIRFVIVDDGSPHPLVPPLDLPLNLTVARVTKDVGWNNGGARNLGAHIAREPWLFLCDIDHLVPEHTCRAMLELDRSDSRVVYTFEAICNGRLLFQPPNIFLISRETFWDMGGYDEDLSGHYGGEDILIRTKIHNDLRPVDSLLVLSAPDDTDYDPPADRGSRTELEINDRIIKQKLALPGYRPQSPLRFPWQIVCEYSLPQIGRIPADDPLAPPNDSPPDNAHTLYRDACRMADQQQFAEARNLLERARAASTDERFCQMLQTEIGRLSLGSGARPGATGNGAGKPSGAAAPCLVAEPERPSIIDGLTGSASQSKTATASRLRIAVVSFLFNWPSSGGGNMHTVGLARALAREGHVVEHFYAKYDPWQIGVTSEPLSIHSHEIPFDADTWQPSIVQRRFREAVDRFQADLVLITDAWNFKPLLAQAMLGYRYILRFDAQECLCPLNNIRLLPSFGNGFTQCRKNQLATPATCRDCVARYSRFMGELHDLEYHFSGVGHDAYQQLLTDMLQQAWAVLTVNPTVANLLEPYAERVYSIPSGIDGDRFPPVQRSDKPKTVHTVLFAGVPEDVIKGCHVLEKACAELWNRRQDFELLVTGEPPGRVNAYTWNIGWQSQSELAQQFASADIVVVPSICQESFPLVAMEAMAAGTPIIASNIGGLPFSIVEGTTGLLFEPGNDIDLARQVESLLDDPFRARQMGIAGRRRFENQFVWDRVIRRHYRPLLRELQEELIAHDA